MGEAFTLLMRGDVFGSVLKAFEISMGLPMFYGALMFTALILIYMKTESIGIVSLTLMLTGFIIFPLVQPQMQLYLGVAAFLGFLGVVYSFWKSK